MFISFIQYDIKNGYGFLHALSEIGIRVCAEEYIDDSSCYDGTYILLQWCQLGIVCF